MSHPRLRQRVKCNYVPPKGDVQLPPKDKSYNEEVENSIKQGGGHQRKERKRRKEKKPCLFVPIPINAPSKRKEKRVGPIKKIKEAIKESQKPGKSLQAPRERKPIQLHRHKHQRIPLEPNLNICRPHRVPDRVQEMCQKPPSRAHQKIPSPLTGPLCNNIHL